MTSERLGNVDVSGAHAMGATLTGGAKTAWQNYNLYLQIL